MASATKGTRRQFVYALVLILVVGAYVSYALLRPLPALQPTMTFTLTKPAKTVALTWPDCSESAVSAIGYGTLGTHGSDQPMPTASVIKVLTALTVLQQYPLSPNETGPTITLTQTDVDSYTKYLAEGGSVVNVAVGEQLTERQALEALLLPSANNMAETLARWAYGSLENYESAAMAYAQGLGMTHTTVTDPSGFLPSTLSSPSDLVLLGQAAIENPTIAQIASEKTATIPVQGEIHSTDAVLGSERIIGLKTGNSDQNPGNFLFASAYPVNNRMVTFVGVTMGCKDLGTALWSTLPLVRSLKDNLIALTVLQAGSTVGAFNVPWEGVIDVEVKHAATIAAWQGFTLVGNTSVNAQKAPINTDSPVGSLTITNGPVTAEEPLYLRKSIHTPPILWRLEHP